MSDSMTGTAWTKRSWWRRLSKTLLDSEASQFLQEHGGRACEVARKAARTARNKGEHRQARHYSIWRCAFPNWAGRSSLSRLRAQSALPASPCPQRFRRVQTK